MKVFSDKPLDAWLEACPVLADLIAGQPAFWRNPRVKPFGEVQPQLGVKPEDVRDAADRLARFRPYIARVFPETTAAGGRIESPLVKIPEMRERMQRRYGVAIPGALWAKLDSHLPISGSIKARGGIYEVLKFAETTAIRHGLLEISDDYAAMDSTPFRDFLGRFSVVVGSTGNLGLSVGIIGAKLGLRVTVHMSADAKQWKKDLLRRKGVAVVEHEGDYSRAVAEGREQAQADPLCHFVDDEHSRDLFLGYAVAAQRLASQLLEQSVRVDDGHPLCVYLPCGVGGGPGGITYGLKLAFGDNVHCFFAEPVQAPAMMVGLATGLHDAISAQDLGIANKTIADGLAVSRPSGFVSRIMQHVVSGVFTVPDDEMSCLLALLAGCEGIRLEPSALAGFFGVPGVVRLSGEIGFSANSERVTHLVWATGGSMVPDDIWRRYFERGMSLLGSGEGKTPAVGR